jgi:hypothetical protein
MLLALAIVFPFPLQAQVRDLGPPTGPDSAAVRRELGFTLITAHPVGKFADYVGPGGGFSLFGLLYMGDRPTLGLRLDLDLIVYGSNTVTRPLSPSLPLVDVEVTTENSIASLALGPQLVLGRGRVRPYLHGSAGVSQFVTTTSVWSSGNPYPFASTQNQEDHAFFLSAGAGVRMLLSRSSRHPIGLELGGHYLRRGLADYLLEGKTQGGSGEEIPLEAIRSETNLATFHLGLTLGFRE